MLKPEILLVAVLVIGFGSAYAEQGKNYDRELLGIENGFAFYKWTSHYERIDDGTKWTNYLSSENATHFVFESANISVIFDKVRCDFELFEPGHIRFANQTVAKVEKDILVDLSQDSLTCEFSKNQNVNGYRIDTKQAGPDYEVRTVFDLTASGFLEWTYELDNHNIIDSKNFTIIEKCPNCNILESNVDKLRIDGYTYDAKNSTHGALKLVDLVENRAVFEKPDVGVFDEPRIDPVFSSDDPTEDGYVTQQQGAISTCVWNSPTRNNSAATNRIEIPDDATPNLFCYMPFWQWDLSSLPNDIIVSETSFGFEVTAVTNARNCDYINLTPLNVTAADDDDLAGAIATNSTYISNDATCTTVGTGKSVTLGSQANTDIETRVATDDLFPLGARFNSMTRDASTHTIKFETEDGGSPTPAPTLEIHYAEPIDYLPETSVNLSVVGDVARIAPSQVINVTSMNVTQMQILVNGTVWKTNSTVINFTSWPSTVTYGAEWFQMDPQGYEFEVQVETDPQPNFNPSGMLSYFTFDDSDEGAGLSDFGVEENHASVSAGTYASVTGGPINNATDLDGSTIYTIPNESDYDFDRTDPFSISLWTNIDSTGSAIDVLLGKGNSFATGNNPGYYFIYNHGSPGSILIRLNDDGNVFDVTASITEDQWNHVVLTYDGSSDNSGMNVYVNTTKTEGGSSTISGSFLNNNDINIGTDSAGNVWLGQVDDVRIFNKKLSETEITQLFNLGNQEISNLETTTQEYDPDYDTAVNPALGNVNYTVTRINSQDTILLKVNRDVNDTTFTINCRVRDSVQTAFNSTQGTWQNRTLTGYANLTFDGFATSHAYGQCQNPPGDLFEFSSFADTTLSLAAINVFDSSFGSMVGVPVGVFFVVMAAAMANKRTAPTFIIVITAIAGAMATIGFFTLEPIVWGLALVSAMLGLFVNQKIF